MSMPIDLVLVRHGESEGNLAHGLSRTGDRSIYSNPEFAKRHSSLWRLTETGGVQSRIAGEWIKKNIGPLDAFFTSEYVRAMETAALLDLPNASWCTEFYLRERDWGQLDQLSHEQQREQHPGELERRERNSFFWQPVGGESVADVCLRIDKVTETLKQECSDKRVIVMCHGEVMWAFRVRLERISQSRYTQYEQSKSPFDRINHCQILHYTRRDPETGRLYPHLLWFRSICPWNPSLSSNEWQVIKRGHYSNGALLTKISKYPRILFKSPHSMSLITVPHPTTEGSSTSSSSSASTSLSSSSGSSVFDGTFTPPNTPARKRNNSKDLSGSAEAHELLVSEGKGRGEKRKGGEEESEEKGKGKSDGSGSGEEEQGSEAKRKKMEDIKRRRLAGYQQIAVSFDQFHHVLDHPPPRPGGRDAS